jgi:hypothetical protein
MNSTPIFDQVYRELDAPPMKFMEPDGTLICYGVRIFVNGEPRNYALTVQGTAPLLNFPALPAPWNGESVINDGC